MYYIYEKFQKPYGKDGLRKEKEKKESEKKKEKMMGKVRR